MPNHVYSYLKIAGDEKDVKALKDLLKSDDRLMDANKLIPYPFREQDDEYHAAFMNHGNGYDEKNPTEAQKKYIEKYGTRGGYPHDGYNMGGYEWCNLNWGTKWGFYDAEIKQEEYKDGKGHLVYYFLTAWSPAVPLFEKMTKLFPKLHLIYTAEDEGGGFTIKFVGENGEVTDSDYNSEDDSARTRKMSVEDATGNVLFEAFLPDMFLGMEDLEGMNNVYTVEEMMLTMVKLLNPAVKVTILDSMLDEVIGPRVVDLEKY